MREELQVWADSREDLGERTAVLRALAAWLATPPGHSAAGHYPMDEPGGTDEIPAPRDDGHGDGEGRITTYRYYFSGESGFAMIDGLGQGNGDGIGGGQGCLIADYPNEQISGNGVGDGDCHVGGGGRGPAFGNGPGTVLAQNSRIGYANGDGGSAGTGDGVGWLDLPGERD